MKKRIALIYDRANTPHGGAERVLLAIKKKYSDLTFFTSLADPKRAKWLKYFPKMETSFLQKIPLAKKFYRYLVFAMPFAFESLNLSAYEIVISVTSAEAKSVITRRDQLHLCYLLSPPRYLYHYRQQYLQQSRFLQLPIIKTLVAQTLNYLAKWDQTAIFRPDIIIPLAQIVKKRAKHFYPKIKLEPVLYPPIETSLLRADHKKTPSLIKGEYLLFVGRLVPYKNIESAIMACQQLQQKLVIVGEGPEEVRLKKISNSLIIFQKNLSEVKLANLYQHCQAVLSPGLDDFSLVALEANLFGKPVIINQLAGAAELIKNGVHGLHLTYSLTDTPSEITQNLVKSLLKLKNYHFDRLALSKNALKYDTNKFIHNFDTVLRKAYQAKKEGRL